MSTSIPEWLDPAAELTDTSDLPFTRDGFVTDALVELLRLGITGTRAIEAVAHCATECAYGRRAIGHNRGGVKAKKPDAVAYKAKQGRPMPWWQYRGHAGSGDAPVVVYRAFHDDPEFWRFWTKRYVPRTSAPNDRYAAAGAAFWSDNPEQWFVELVLAGYRGPVREGELRALISAGTSVEEHPSVKTHRKVVADVVALAVLR